MNNDRELPPLTFGENCDYSMLTDILSGWVVRVWTDRPNAVILTGEWLGMRFIPPDDVDGVLLKTWSEAEQRYTKEVLIKTDSIVKIEIQ